MQSEPDHNPTTDILFRLRERVKLRRSMDARGYDTDLLQMSADEIERLRVAIVNAAVPLEAMLLTSTMAILSPEMRDAIHMAVTAIRDAVGVKAA